MGKCINTVYRTSITKDSAVAAEAGVATYKLRKGQNGLRHARWAFSIDQCISCLFFFIVVP